MDERAARVGEAKGAGPGWVVGSGYGLADLAAFLWGFAEATLFFVIPDVLLTYTAAWSWRRGVRQLVLAVLGALLGGVFMFMWAARQPDAARAAVAAVPFVRPSMIERVEAELDRHGVWALCIGPTNGVPYKAYAVAAPGRVDIEAFSGVSVLARAERFVISVGVASVVGWWIRRKAERPGRVILLAHGFTWIVFYAIYWTVVSLR